MSDFLAWVVLLGFGAVLVILTYAIVHKIQLERKAGHQIRAHHFISPFDDVTVSRK